MKITVRNQQRTAPVPARRLNAFARRASQACLQMASDSSPLPGLAEVAVLIVSDAQIADLHQRFMQIAGPTDIITFEHGDIAISAETAMRNAVRYNASLEEELELCIAHGLLHLSGFDDKRNCDAAAMRAAEMKVLAMCRAPIALSASTA